MNADQVRALVSIMYPQAMVTPLAAAFSAIVEVEQKVTEAEFVSLQARSGSYKNNSTPTITTAQSYAAMLAREAIQTEPLQKILSPVQYTTGDYPIRTFHVEFFVEDVIIGMYYVDTFDGRSWTRKDAV